MRFISSGQPDWGTFGLAKRRASSTLSCTDSLAPGYRAGNRSKKPGHQCVQIPCSREIANRRAA